MQLGTILCPEQQQQTVQWQHVGSLQGGGGGGGGVGAGLSQIWVFELLTLSDKLL